MKVAKNGINRYNFDLTQLNFWVTMTYLIVGYLLFAIFTSYPMEYYTKGPYFLGSLMSVWMFQNIMLCPG